MSAMSTTSARPALIVSHRCHAVFAAELTALVARLNLPHEVLALPEDKDGRLPEADVARGEIAFYSQDLNPSHARQFFSAVRKGPNIKWIHVFNIGVDHPIYTEMLERGVRVTTSAGTTALPISQTAITGMLMLSRGFPLWLRQQAERRWQHNRKDRRDRQDQQRRGEECRVAATPIAHFRGSVAPAITTMCMKNTTPEIWMPLSR